MSTFYFNKEEFDSPKEMIFPYEPIRKKRDFLNRLVQESKIDESCRREVEAYLCLSVAEEPVGIGYWPDLGNGGEIRLLWELTNYETFKHFIFPAKEGPVDELQEQKDQLNKWLTDGNITRAQMHRCLLILLKGDSLEWRFSDKGIRVFRDNDWSADYVVY